MSEDDLVVVFETTDDLECVMYRSMLQEARVSVMERDPWTSRLNMGTMIVPWQLLVYRRDAEQALSLIEAYRQAVKSGELRIEEW